MSYYDTSNASTGTISYEYLEWYPDWQSTDGIPPTTSMTELPSQSPATFTVSWTGVDGGPSGLKNYDVQVRDGEAGAWTNWMMATTATSSDYTGVGGQRYYFRSRGRDMAGIVEAWPQTSDVMTRVESLPPQSSVYTRLEKTRYDIVVWWGGNDPGESGVDTFDVQYMDSAQGVWFDWLMDTNITGATFSSIPGHTYYFRSRATDKAQNEEKWPEGNGDASVTFYYWMISGKIKENRGIPLEDVSVETNPAAFNVSESGVGGYYDALVSQDVDTYTVNWQKNGYGNLPQTFFTSTNHIVHAVLPPADNQITNWGFEAGGLSSWLFGGNQIPVVTADYSHTGEHSVFLGSVSEDNFAPAEILANSVDWITSKQLLVDDSGVIHLIWVDMAVNYMNFDSGVASAPEILFSCSQGTAIARLDTENALHIVCAGWNGWTYIQRTPAGVWTSPVALPFTGYEWSIQMEVDLNNIPHFVWTNSYGEILYSRGLNSTLINISVTTGDSWSPDLTICPDGSVNVVWYDRTYGNGDILFATRTPAGEWLAPINISDDPWESQYPTILAGSDDALHIVWQDSDSFYGQFEGRVQYANRDPFGNWGEPKIISDFLPESYFLFKAAIDSKNHIYVLYRRSIGNAYSLYYNFRDSDGYWSQLRFISTIDMMNSGELFVDKNDTVYSVWIENTASDEFVNVMRLNDAGGSPQTIYSVSVTQHPLNVYPYVLVDGGGQIYVIWSAIGSLFVAHTNPINSLSGDSTVSQPLTVPVTMTHPTLSFLYQLNGASQTGGTGLSVTISDGLTTTEIFSTSTNTSDWTHAWYDLSPWISQTITLTFNVHEEAGYPYAWAYLDEVTVGSAHPDIWVSAAGEPSAALPGETVVYEIGYGNRGAVDAVSATLTATLPAGLTFVSASQPVTPTGSTLVWDVGELPAASAGTPIVITATVNAQAVSGSELVVAAELSSQTSELELANNSAQAAIYVGKRIYLPLLQR